MSGHEIHLIWHIRQGYLSMKVYIIDILRVSDSTQLKD